MPKRVVGLSAVSVRHLPPGRYADGLNLYLDVQSPAARYWVFRYTLAGRAREKGLGPASGRAAVSLAEVRRKVRPLYDMVRDGRDPLAERDAARAAAKNAEAKGKTFSDVATLYVAAHEVGWKSARHHHQWTRSLRDYVLPRIGDLPVDEISVAHVMAVLEPIWHDVPETASRVRGRIESVLDYAKARGWRHGENCARWRGHLNSLLPSRARLAAVEHHPALPWHEIAEFMADLRNQGGGVPGTGARIYDSDRRAHHRNVGRDVDGSRPSNRRLDGAGVANEVRQRTSRAVARRRHDCSGRRCAVARDNCRRPDLPWELAQSSALSHGDARCPATHEPPRRNRAWFP